MKLVNSIYTLILIAPFASTVWLGPVAAAGASPAESELHACISHYNELLLRAKKSLSDGDRNGAISLLLEAHTQLGHCQEIREQSPAASVRLGFNQRERSAAGPSPSCALD